MKNLEKKKAKYYDYMEYLFNSLYLDDYGNLKNLTKKQHIDNVESLLYAYRQFTYYTIEYGNTRG